MWNPDTALGVGEAEGGYGGEMCRGHETVHSTPWQILILLAVTLPCSVPSPRVAGKRHPLGSPGVRHSGRLQWEEGKRQGPSAPPSPWLAVSLAVAADPFSRLCPPPLPPTIFCLLSRLYSKFLGFHLFILYTWIVLSSPDWLLCNTMPTPCPNTQGVTSPF